MPTVTAVVPTYNRAHFLGEALDSILQQTRPPEEIVVVDDGSTDDTTRVLARYGNRIRQVHQANAGPSAARNRGIRVATGDFVAFLDSDDLWAKDRLELQLAALSRFPELDFLFGLEAKFSRDQQFEPREIKDPEVLARLNAADCVIHEPFALLLQEDYIPTSTVLFRRSCFDRIGPIDESLRLAEDYDFWIRFALLGCRFGFVNSVLCRRRLHEGNLVNEWVNRTISTATVLARYCDHLPQVQDRLARRLSELYYDVGSRLMYERRFAQAYHYLRLSNPRGHLRLIRHVKLTLAGLLKIWGSIVSGR